MRRSKAFAFFLSACLKMGGAGDPPAPVGDPPTGTAASYVARRPCPLARTVAAVPSGESPTGTAASYVARRPCPLARIVAAVPSGESPDGTGGSPVLPDNH